MIDKSVLLLWDEDNEESSNMGNVFIKSLTSHRDHTLKIEKCIRFIFSFSDFFLSIPNNSVFSSEEQAKEI